MRESNKEGKRGAGRKRHVYCTDNNNERETDREIDRERLRGRYVCRDIVGRLRDIVG